jgi:hypothetical protein
MKRNLVVLAAAALLAGMVGTDDRWTRRIHRQPRGWSIWRAIDWQRADDITDLQSVYAVHGDSVARGAGVAGKPWFSVSLTAENCWCCGWRLYPPPSAGP